MSGPLKSIYKVAILVDWENVRYRIFDENILKKHGIPNDLIINYNKNPQKAINFLKSFVDLQQEDIFRIYFYTCLYPETIKLKREKLNIHKDEDRKRIEALYPKYVRNYELSKSLVNSIAKMDNVQVRLGHLSPREEDKDIAKSLRFEQKQVDMLIGLDVATLSYKRLVDRIILFSYDTDLLPAILLAKDNGVQIVLPAIEGIIEPPKEMIREADFVRNKNYVKIVESLDT